MNILYVTLGFYPALAWGGPVKIVHQNCKELVRRGHHVTVYCTNLINKNQKMSSRTFEKEIDGIRVVYFHTLNLPNWPGTLGPIWLPGQSKYLKKEITTFDIIHLVGYRNPLFLIPAKIARSREIPFVIQPQGSLPISISSFFLKRLYDKFLGNIELKGVSALIALQEKEKQAALSLGVPPERIEIIPNGIEAIERGSSSSPGKFRRDFGLSFERPLILSLGRISKIKGIDMLVEAVSKLRDLNPQLVIIGPDDGQLDDIQKAISRLGIEKNVLLTGLVSDEVKFSAYQAADLFVLPSRQDAYPTTIMEACRVGLPMVVTDGCQMSHLVHNRIGDVVPFDVDAFALAVRKLLTDRVRYELYKSNCQEMFNEVFSINTVVDQLEGLYQHAIGDT